MTAIVHAFDDANQRVMSAQICCRLAVSTDLDRVHALSCRCLGPDAWSLADIEAEWSREDGRVTVAEIDGIVQGYAMVRRVLDEAELLQIAVDPAVRRQGMGRLLLDELWQWALQDGILTVFLEVRESNAGAQKVYEACGFEAVGRRRGYYQSPREDCILMSRRYA